MGYEIIAKTGKVLGAMLGRKWPEKAGGIGGGLGWFLATGFRLYPPLAQLDGSGAWFTTAAATGTLFLGMTAAFALGRRQWASPERQARRLVNKLHEEWFPGPDGTVDPDFRLSLWTPDPSPDSPITWRCLHRTLEHTKKSWKHVHDPKELRYAGVVVYSACKQMNMDIRGVEGSARNDLQAISEYRKRARVSDDRHSKMSWKFAALRSVIVRSPNGAVSAVLLVERESGLPISNQLEGKAYWAQVDGEYRPVDVLATELGLVANIWGATIAPPEGGI